MLPSCLFSCRACCSCRQFFRKAMVTTIYNEEGLAIGENVDGRVNWYYSDGSAGGRNGGHYMGTMEFLTYNGLI